MIDKKRLYLMINLARFEQKNEDRALRVNHYYQRDYIAFALIKNFLLTTIAYVLVLGVLALYNMEAVLEGLNSLDLRTLMATVILGYLIFLGIYSVIAFIAAKLKYVRMENSMEQYTAALDRLRAMYGDTEPIGADSDEDDDEEDDDEYDDEDEDEDDEEYEDEYEDDGEDPESEDAGDENEYLEDED
uniref:hypothetical protein n=1 Tax=Eubacterium cellulosolvens TaxID=29322 RepID=UPI000688F926|nr:hypothetical protein [[Eubacterium] cellulosolvens]